MPRCSDCHRDLPPGFQTLCQECYDAKYAQIGRPKRPKSFRERLTRRNVLLFLGTYAGVYLYLALRKTLDMNVFHLADPMPIKLMAMVALVMASIAFWVESGR